MAFLWEKRHLLQAMTIRDIKIKYSKSLLGVGWMLFQPLSMLLVFTFFFTQILHVKGDEMPYALFAFCGMAAWNFFSNSSIQASMALISNRHLLQKVSLPLLYFPLSKIIIGLIEQVFYLLILVVLLYYYKIAPGTQIILFPLFLLMNFLITLCLAIWIQLITVRNRDFLQAISYLLNLAMWLTPVFYPIEKMNDTIRWISYFNPMSSVVQGYRWTLAGGAAPDMLIFCPFLLIFIGLVTGIILFKNRELKFAEEL
jgi:lipopolysaccharide transport system permease protein